MITPWTYRQEKFSSQELSNDKQQLIEYGRVLGFPTRVLGSIVDSIRACHVRDPGSIPGRGGNFLLL